MKPVYLEDLKTLEYILGKCKEFERIELTKLFGGKEVTINPQAILKKYRWFCEVIHERGAAEVYFLEDEIVLAEIPLHTTNFINSGGFQKLYEEEKLRFNYENRMRELEVFFEKKIKKYQSAYYWLLGLTLLSLLISVCSLIFR